MLMFTVITVNVSGKILSGDYTSGFNRVTAKFSRVEFYRRLTSATLSAACLLLVREITDRGGKPQIVVIMTGDNDIKNILGDYTDEQEVVYFCSCLFISN